MHDAKYPLIDEKITSPLYTCRCLNGRCYRKFWSLKKETECSRCGCDVKSWPSNEEEPEDEC